VVQGEWIFVCGTTGFDYSAMSIADVLEEQAEQCFRNISQALAHQAPVGWKQADPTARVAEYLPCPDALGASAVHSLGYVGSRWDCRLTSNQRCAISSFSRNPADS
jgi:hypothetical protein